MAKTQAGLLLWEGADGLPYSALLADKTTLVIYKKEFRNSNSPTYTLNAFRNGKIMPIRMPQGSLGRLHAAVAAHARQRQVTGRDSRVAFIYGMLDRMT